MSKTKKNHLNWKKIWKEFNDKLDAIEVEDMWNHPSWDRGNKKYKSQFEYFKCYVRKYNNTSVRLPWKKINKEFQSWIKKQSEIKDWPSEKRWLMKRIESHISDNKSAKGIDSKMAKKIKKINTKKETYYEVDLFRELNRKPSNFEAITVPSYINIPLGKKVKYMNRLWNVKKCKKKEFLIIKDLEVIN